MPIATCLPPSRGATPVSALTYSMPCASVAAARTRWSGSASGVIGDSPAGIRRARATRRALRWRRARRHRCTAARRRRRSRRGRGRRRRPGAPAGRPSRNHSRVRTTRMRSVASRSSRSGGGSVVAAPPGTSTPFSARYCRASASAWRDATTASSRPCTTRSRTGASVPDARRASAAIAATSVSGPSLITESAVNADAAAPQAMPECATTPCTSPGKRTPRIAASPAPDDMPAATTRAGSAR